jgi:hypothetical protein
MEKLKDPAMLLSVVNSIGLIGTTVYFYKQLESMRSDMVKISQTLTGILRKISEIEKGEQNKSDALYLLNEQVKRINEQIDELESLENMDNLDMDLSEIISVLKDNNISVERPSQINYGRRSGDRRGSSRRSNNESNNDYRRETCSRTSRQNNDRPERTRSDLSREIDYKNIRTSTRDGKNNINGTNKNEYEVCDDNDLIGEVRRQQLR